MHPTLLLGSALWGWTVSRETAFQLLDDFYRRGFRQVDAATNYPINKDPADFRRAEQILLEWVQTHGVQDLEVMMKVGSLNNLFTPDNNLTKSFLLMNLDDYQAKFGSNLHAFMIHWDNRQDAAGIDQSLQALNYARRQGLQIGLSGIRYPEIYHQLNQQYQFDFSIQIKHNLLHSDYERYAPFHGKRRFIAYGINAGGLKFSTAAYHERSSLKVRGGNIAETPPIVQRLEELLPEINQIAKRPHFQSFNHIGLCYAFHSPDIRGILLGCSRPEQLADSIAFHRHLVAFDYRDVYLRLLELIC
jgi:aryl-alcohol dehydrogenase-like predicted oxidoreductase